MTLELNEVMTAGLSHPLSLIVGDGQLACVSGGTRQQRTDVLRAILGLEPVASGVVSVDGMPVTPRSASWLRRYMAFAPEVLPTIGRVSPLEPPSVQDVFSLKANRDAPISNGLLAEEMRRTGVADEERARLLATAVLLRREIILVSEPADGAANYLLAQAAAGRIVVVATSAPEWRAQAHVVAELP